MYAGTSQRAAAAALGLLLAACSSEPAPSANSSATAAVQPDAALGDGGVSPFYSLGAPAPRKPGALIRHEALTAEQSLSGAGVSTRILYSSTDGIDGTSPIAVSGALFLPKGEAPKGGWPLMAWAHGTVGVADVCAPSWTKRSDRDARYLNYWLGQGYAVVASDYQGLGVPGGHPYLATRAAAYSVLDSIRAVQHGDFPVSRKVVLVGQSQGGGAAFATAAEASAYAPELDIRGSVATGTPYFTATTPPVVRNPAEVSPQLGYSFFLLYLAKLADPGFKFEDYVTPQGAQIVKLGATACYGAVARGIMEMGVSTQSGFKQDPTPEIAKFYPMLSYSTLKVKGPVFMGTGGKDIDVPPQGQTRLFHDACKAGAKIEHHVYPELDHSGAVNGSLADSTPFVKKAFAGEPISGNCP